MPQRDKVMVLMDTSEADKNLLKYLEKIAIVNDTKEIHIFNSISEMKIPEQVLKDFPEIKENSIADRKAKLRQTVEEHLPQELIDICQIQVKEGAPSKAILKYVEKNNIDLLMMGRHKNFIGGGVLSTRLARRAACSIFIIPENSELSMDTLHVPCDFSEHSKIAMEEAIRIARRYENMKIICQNVYTVPGGYHYSGKSYEEFAEVMRSNAERDYREFISRIDHNGINLDVVYSLDTNDNPVTDIIDYAHEIKPSAIVIGVKGRTATTALFIGSRAEQLIQYNNDIPMMVVRPKGKNSGLMDLLKEI